MQKPGKKTVCTIIVVVGMIISAYICRMIGNSGIFSKEMGIIRSSIYISLYIAWGFSLYSRIIQPRIRRYMTSIASLMVFWFVIRTIKFSFISAVTHPNIVRYIWYFYYLGMLFIPLLAALVAMSIGKPESYCLPKKAAFLYVPTIVLFLLVITNDFHQFVFTFPKDAKVWTDYNNGYTVGYYLVVICLFICALTMLMEMYGKRRVVERHKLILIPCMPIIILILYLILYFSGSEWLRYFAGDVTAFICLMYAMTLELSIQCGFIQANVHYMELFDACTVGVQITDEECNTILSSKTAEKIDMEILRKIDAEPFMLEGGIRLSGASIQGGRVFWTEDVSPLLNILEELEEAKENLKDSNGILEEENAVKAREAHIAEQDRLYNIIQRDTARQIRLMDEMIEQVEAASTEEEKTGLLKKMLVIGAYLKRRSNLVFLADKSSWIEAREVALCIRESMDNLEACGITCGFYSELKNRLLAVHAIGIYDFLEEIIEHSIDCMDTMMVRLGSTGGLLSLTIDTDSSYDFTDFASEIVTVIKDEDDEWRLTMKMEEVAVNEQI